MIQHDFSDDSDTSAPTGEGTELLVHEQTVRSVARRYFEDANDVEDVVQETWLVGLRESLRSRRNPSVHNLRAWYAEVARRVSLGIRSARARRPYVATALDELCDRTLHAGGENALLLARLNGLKDPYRTTILMRYYGGLSARAIATRMGVPMETVRTRLRRGLDQLEGDLRSEYPERARRTRRGSWSLAWWLAWRSRVTASNALAAGMLCCISTLALLVAWQHSAQTQDTGAALALGGVQPAGARPARAAGAAGAEALGTAALLEFAPSSRSQVRAASTADSAERTVRGQARDLSGAPVSGARVMGSASNSSARELLGRTDAAGRFDVALVAGRRFVWIEDDSRTSDETFVAAAHYSGGGNLEFRLVPSRVVRGRVSDAAGRPVAGAEIGSPHVATYYERRAGAQPGTGWARLSWASATSQSDGTFELVGVPSLPVQLTLEHPDFVTHRRLALATTGFEAQLRAPTGVRLRVGDGAGEWLADAQLQIAPAALANGAVLARSGAGWSLTGLTPLHRYVVRVDAPARPTFLATVTAPERGVDERVLRAAQSRRLRGVVLGAAGEGLAGARVELRIRQETPLGEAPLGSAGGAWDLGVLATVRADDRGHFDVPGLPDTELVVRVTAPDGTHPAAVRHWSPSANLLVIETARRPGAVVCRVVDGTTGRPVSGARIGIGDRSQSALIVQTRSAVDGRFPLGSDPHQQGLVTLWAPGYATALWSLETARARGRLVLFPKTSTTLQLEDRAGLALTGGFVQLLDLEGQPLLSALERGKYADTLAIGPRGRVGLLEVPRRRIKLRVIPTDLGAVEEFELDLRSLAPEHRLRLVHFDRSDDARRVRVDLAASLGGDWPTGDFELSVRGPEGRLIRSFRGRRGDVGLLIDPEVRTHLAVHDPDGVSLRTFNFGARPHFAALRGADPYLQTPCFDLQLPEAHCRLELRTDDGVLHLAQLPAGGESQLTPEFVRFAGEARASR